MKPILLALALAAASLTLIGVGLYFTRENLPREVPYRDPGVAVPADIPVLSGESGAVEVLVKRRFFLDERATFTDRSLARRLGLGSDEWSFLEVLVLNGSQRAVVCGPESLVVEDAAGRRIPARRLRSLVSDPTPVVKTLLAALDPAGEAEILPGRLRRCVVAVAKTAPIESLVAGKVGGVALRATRAVSARLAEYLDRPKAGLLVAVLADDDATVQPGGEDR